MTFHILKLIFRNLLRFKTTFFINLTGLSTGLACALLIYLWISDEWSFDKFHKNHSKIFQVMENKANPSDIVTGEATPIGMAYVLAETMPEVEYAATVTPMAWFPKFIIEHEGTRVKNEGKFVGKDFFEIFSFALAYGNKDSVFRDVNSIVISEDLARSLFGSVANAAGKNITWTLGDIKKESIVTAVFKKLPSNSSEQFDLLLNIDLLARIMNFAQDDLTAPGPSTFLTLKAGTDIKAFNRKVTQMMANRTGNRQSNYFVTRFSDKYLYGKFENGIQTGGRIEYVRLFALIGFITLLVACVNFMNLSTAKASRRIKDVGVKKVMGALRRNLIVEYFGESILISFVALGVALVLVAILLPSFNDMTGKQLELNFSPGSLAIIFGGTFITGIVAGSYPALYLSGFNPAAVLKGMLKSSLGEIWTRKGLVIFQFSVSVIFIVCVVVIHRQMSFVQNRNLGYDKDNILYFELEGKVSGNPHAFLNAVRIVPGVKNASAMVGNLIGTFGNPTDVTVGGHIVPVNRLNVDYEMIETLGIPMKAGRTFSASFNDLGKIILNEAAVDRMGIVSPLGRQIDLGGVKFEIIGVTKNFHYRSLHEAITPLAFSLETERLWNAFVKIENGQEGVTIKKLKALYNQFNPGFSFDYNFLDHAYQSQYASERRVASLSLYFAILTILVSCLGLFGLAVFTVERRVKEIGIRKVLGATPQAIVYLLSVDFIKLILAAILVGLPVSYFIASHWLRSFAYAIDLETWFFIGSALITIAIALITVGSQAIRASITNPTECLRDS